MAAACRGNPSRPFSGRITITSFLLATRISLDCPITSLSYIHICGHLPLILILICPFLMRRSKILAISFALFLFSILWMLGKSTPLYPPVFHLMPKFLQGAMYQSMQSGFSLFAAITARSSCRGFKHGYPGPFSFIRDREFLELDPCGRK